MQLFDSVEPTNRGPLDGRFELTRWKIMSASRRSFVSTCRTRREI